LLLFGGEDSVSDDAGRMLDEVRLEDGLLAGRRDAGRADLVEPLDRAVPDLAEDLVVPDLVVPDLVVPDLEVPDLDVVDPVFAADVLLVVPPVRAVLRVPVDALAVDDDLDVDRDDDARALVAPLERVALGVATFIADMVFAAALRAFAAVDIDLVAVFIARMALDIVFADAVALVAAAVILLAAELTLVAADDTPRAAVAGVVELLDVERVVREAVEREVDGRDEDARDAVRRVEVARDEVERDVLLRVDRAAVLRLADDPLRAGRAVAVRDVLVLLADLVAGRRAVPPDALRLPDLLRAVLAELRRVAARVVV
jgi:hypothetical protein